MGAVVVGLVGLLLLLATFADGAFDARYWAPLGVFALAALGALLTAGTIALPASRAALVALAALWAFAGWDLVSVAWAESPGGAWEGAARTVTYAALVSIALLAAGGVRERRVLAWSLLAGVVSIGLVTLLRLFIDAEDAFLAGRLDDPIGYRNGTAALFAFSVWPLIGLAAERGRHPLLRAAAFSGVVLGLELAFLTQSRGVLIGLVAGAAVSVAIGPDRLRRVWLGMVGVAVVAAASGALLTPYDAFDGGAGEASGDDIRTAANAILVSLLAAGVGSFLYAAFDNGLRSSPKLDETGRRVAIGALVVFAVVGAIGALSQTGNPVSYADEKLEEFTSLEEQDTTASTRLGSVSGQRYDLYRVAWDEFESDPLLGVGEGSYAVGYYRERRTDRNLSVPHSLPLRLLAETGLVGFVLFLAFLTGLGLAIGRAARMLDQGDRVWAAGLAAAGTTVLAQSLTDWLWLLPGLMGLALLSLGLVGGIAQQAGPGDEGSVRAHRTAIAAAVAAGVLATGLAVFYLSDLYVREARASGENPQERLDAARTAEELNPFSATPLYLQASALEALGERAQARQALEKALEQEPDSFVTLGLIGDLDLRAGERRRARAFYRRALELNPRDLGLQELAGRSPPE